MSRPSYTTPSDGAHELVLAHGRTFPHEAFAMSAASPDPETAAYRRGVEDACEAGGVLIAEAYDVATEAEHRLSLFDDARAMLRRLSSQVEDQGEDEWRATRDLIESRIRDVLEIMEKAQ